MNAFCALCHCLMEKACSSTKLKFVCVICKEAVVNLLIDACCDWQIDI